MRDIINIALLPIYIIIGIWIAVIGSAISVGSGFLVIAGWWKLVDLMFIAKGWFIILAVPAAVIGIPISIAGFFAISSGLMGSIQCGYVVPQLLSNWIAGTSSEIDKIEF